MSSSLLRTPSLVAVSVLLAGGLACSSGEPDSVEGGAAGKASAKPAPKPRPDGLVAGPHNLGPLRAGTAPTVEAVDAVLPDKYTVRAAAEGATAGAAVQVLLGDDVILEVFPSADGAAIARAWSKHPHVVFPWDTKVGTRIGGHKNWGRMTCTLAPAPFEGKALCNAFAEARIAYLIEGWEGEQDRLPGKELLADLAISGVVWTPDPPKAGEGKKAGGE